MEQGLQMESKCRWHAKHGLWDLVHGMVLECPQKSPFLCETWCVVGPCCLQSVALENHPKQNQRIWVGVRSFSRSFPSARISLPSGAKLNLHAWHSHSGWDGKNGNGPPIQAGFLNSGPLEMNRTFVHGEDYSVILLGTAQPGQPISLSSRIWRLMIFQTIITISCPLRGIHISRIMITNKNLKDLYHRCSRALNMIGVQSIKLVTCQAGRQCSWGSRERLPSLGVQYEEVKPKNESWHLTRYLGRTEEIELFWEEQKDYKGI